MLASRASGAFVCIRCELNAARPRFPALRRAAVFSTSARRRHENETNPPEQAAPDNERFDVYRPQLSDNILVPPRRGKGRGRLRQTTASLGEDIKTLGDDAEILVLREDPADRQPLEEAVTPQPDPAYPIETFDILGSLQDERRPITPEEIVKQLDSLRPKTHAEPDEPQYVNQTTYIRLSRQLSQSFNGRQLSHYYSVTKGVARKNVDKQVLDNLKQLQKKAKRPAKRSDWHPGTTPIDRRLPSLDMRLTSKKPISKHLLVDQILRDLWKLVLLEEIEAPGELELLLKPWQLSLLTSGPSPTPLDRIGRDRRAKIEMHLAHNVVRITADKNTADYAADDLEQLIQNIVTKQFSLNDWAPYLEDSARENLANVFSKKDLQSISGITEANFQFVPNQTVMIRALNKDSIAQAERCLLRVLPRKNHVKTSINTTLRDAVKDDIRLSPVYFEKDHVSFEFRERNLGRWTLPIPRTREPASAEETQALVDTAATDLSKIVKEIVDQADESKQPITGWTKRTGLSVGAQFGQVLFSTDKSTSDVDAFPPFLASTPGLPKILTDPELTRKKQDGALSTLRYKFIAAPDQQFPLEGGKKIPDLIITFRYNRNAGEHRIHRISLMVSNHLHDVLLPGKAVDVRFSVDVRFAADKGFTRDLKALGSSSSTFRDFEASVSQALSDGGTVTAPDLTLKIPTIAISGTHAPDAPLVTPVKYIFAGVRFHQSVAATLHDADISLVSIQGGKLNRSSVSMASYLNFDRKSQRDASDSDEQQALKTFLSKTFMLVDKITDATANSRPVATSTRNRPSKSAELTTMPSSPTQDSVQPKKTPRPHDPPPFINRTEEDIAREVSDYPPTTTKKKERNPTSARKLRRMGLQDGAAVGVMESYASASASASASGEDAYGEEVSWERQSRVLETGGGEDSHVGGVLAEESATQVEEGEVVVKEQDEVVIREKEEEESVRNENAGESEGEGESTAKSTV